MSITRAKKFVWQSSRLAPLVCKFGWAICIGGGLESEGGLLAHTHYTLHAIYCVQTLNNGRNDITFQSQSKGLFLSTTVIMASRLSYSSKHLGHTHTLDRPIRAEHSFSSIIDDCEGEPTLKRMTDEEQARHSFTKKPWCPHKIRGAVKNEKK